MGDTSTKLQENSGSNLDPGVTVSSGKTQSVDPERPKVPATDIVITKDRNQSGSNDPDKLKPNNTKLTTPPNTSSPSSLNNRYDIYPGNPLPEFNSPSAQAF